MVIKCLESVGRRVVGTRIVNLVIINYMVRDEDVEDTRNGYTLTDG